MSPEEILTTAFCGEFFRGIEQYTTPLTRLGYARDIQLFFDFFCIFFTRGEL